MGSDENLHLDEDMDDEDRRSSHSDDPEYDVNKETDLGEEEDQAHDELQRRLVEYEIPAECAPPINDNVVSEFVCDSQGQSHMQSQVKTTGGGGRVKEPVKRKARGATKAFKKPGVPMVLEYDEFGQPAGQWRDKYSQHVGILTRKIPITLDWAEVPLGLLQTAWDDTMSVFNIPDEPTKRKSFEAFVQERFKNFKSYLRTRWIHKKKRKRPKKNKQATEGEEKPDIKPWELYPQILPDDWNKFVAKSVTAAALEKSEKARTNAQKKLYSHHMGCKTFAESRPKWIKEGLYPIDKFSKSDKTLSSTVSTLVCRAIDWWCAMHGIDKNTASTWPPWKLLVQSLLNGVMKKLNCRSVAGPTWKYAKCAQQDNGVDCALYVMRFMFAIVNCCTEVQHVEEVCAIQREGPLTSKEIDEIRDMWAYFVTFDGIY